VTTAPPTAPDRPELLHLHDARSAVAKDELASAYQYLSFYIGLVGALLAATLAGYLHLDKGDGRGIALLAGPLMSAILGILGYDTVSVFYRRFAEAWVSAENLSTLLGWYDRKSWESDVPPYPATLNGGPLARPLNPLITGIFDRGRTEHWTAEQMARAIHAESPTLRYALLTFASYSAIGVALAVLILLRVFQSTAIPAAT
jgi:hypothetical protein